MANSLPKAHKSAGYSFCAHSKTVGYCAADDTGHSHSCAPGVAHKCVDLTISVRQGEKSTLGYWLADALKDEVVRSIVESPELKRLADISFLGALDYTHKGSVGLSKRFRSRLEHSLHVAALANYVSHLRGYPTDLRRHLIVAALVHDVGHAPLSHSAEPYIKSKMGYGHHEAGERVIRGHTPIGKTLNTIIQQSCDVSFVINLISMTAPDSEGGDLFSSPINIDTIDGILRSHTYLVPTPSPYTHLEIAKAALSNNSERNINALDFFWGMKGRVYSYLINNEYGILSDKISELFFESELSLDESGLLVTERAWKEKYGLLFESLRSLMNHGTPPSWVSDTSVNIIDRKYFLRTEVEDNKRFACEKEKKRIRLKSFANGYVTDQEQLSIF